MIHIFFLAAAWAMAPGQQDVFPGVGEKTPSRCFYFDWINSQYEGSTEEETLINLEFFRWLHDEFGMVLDIYSLDVGNIDDGPFTAGVGRLIPDHCGTLDSLEFKRQFPRGFDPIAEKAGSFGCRLGIWLGPDGFGNTPEEEKTRAAMLVKLCRDHRFMLFKFDAVAGGLPEEKQDAFIRTLEECRKHCPDLIVLNERIDLGNASPFVTTSLWEGAETYIDVFNSNPGTAPHHRAGALARPLVPGLERLIEDHGVCLSSCLDYWEDDLVLQAFNRCLILAPEIYGNPWLLADEEFPRLARLCNLHRRFRKILVDGMALPEDVYGPFAATRGDGERRFITLRNLTWYPIERKIRLDGSIGLDRAGSVRLRRLHPSERIFGSFEWGSEVAVVVEPFRSCLLAASTRPLSEVGVIGCEYEVTRDLPDKPVKIDLLGLPGSPATIELDAGGRRFSGAMLDGKVLDGLVDGRKVDVSFPGMPLRKPWHRKIGDLAPCEVPQDAEALYEATCFAADNNALEVRSLIRSGPSRIPPVARARESFFGQPMFRRRGIWDRNLFDGDLDTFFMAREAGGVLRVDFGEPTSMDELVIRIKSRYERPIDGLHDFTEDNRAEASADLVTWTPAGHWSGKGSYAVVELKEKKPVRYLRVIGAPRRVAEIEGFRGGDPLDRSRWRASNLFGAYAARPAAHSWSMSFTLDEAPRGSYLALALPGRHGREGACAALRAEGLYVGAPDRAVSFPSNPWEYKNVDSDRDYTYYFPVTEDLMGKKIDAVVLILKDGIDEIRPELFITAHPRPLARMELVLSERRSS